MDHPEGSPQQQYIANGASQVANSSSNVCVPVSSMTELPPLPVSTTQDQFVYQDAQAQSLEHVRERLRLFWANQMKETKPADLKNHSLPLSRIKKIMQADKDVKMIGKETTAVFAKACEMFILDMTSRAWINTEEDKRRIVQNKDIAAVISKTDIFDFLEGVTPRDELREPTLKTPSAEPRLSRYNIPQQHGVGASSVTSAGGEQPLSSMPSHQTGLQNQQSSILGPQAQNQQPFMPWPQAQQQLDQQNLEQPSPHN